MLRVVDRHAIGNLLSAKGVDLWGVAANTPRLPRAPALPIAISMLMRLNPLVVHDIRHGPTRKYVEEYRRLNLALDEASAAVAEVLTIHGHRAERVPATMGGHGPHTGFAHKTAATTAGLGWIGKTALFVSPEFGPAVRLATLFTDLELPTGEPIVESRCGSCRACVSACPAGCGRDVLWRAGMARDELFDADACRRHMAGYTAIEAEICGICIAACPLAAA
jgi:epoxyqueuosine reductase